MGGVSEWQTVRLRRRTLEMLRALGDDLRARGLLRLRSRYDLIPGPWRVTSDLLVRACAVVARDHLESQDPRIRV